jgi:hypothetical protein
MYLYSVYCVRGGWGIGLCGEHITEVLGVIHCVFDQIPNLQNCFTTPGGLGKLNTCRQVSLIWCFYSYLVHAYYQLCRMDVALVAVDVF